MKAQYSVTYLALFVLLSILFMGGIITLNSLLERNTNTELTQQMTYNIGTRIEKTALDIRILNNKSEADYIIKEVSIPARIGDNTYSIQGDTRDKFNVALGTTDYSYNLIFQTQGKDSIINIYNISMWDINISGTAFSTNQKVTLNYSVLNDTLKIY
jgi:hypothetical protein